MQNVLREARALVLRYPEECAALAQALQDFDSARAKYAAKRRTVFVAPYATNGKQGKRKCALEFLAGETCTVIGERADAVIVQTEDVSRTELALPLCLYGHVWKYKE